MGRIGTKAVAAAVLAAGCLAVPVAAATAATDPFGGTWTSIDTDGSHQVLAVHAAHQGRRPASLFDDAAGVCGGAPARLAGSASADGDHLLLRGALTCLPGGNPLRGAVAVGFTYDPSTDTLVDDFGVIWHRFD